MKISTNVRLISTVLDNLGTCRWSRGSVQWFRCIFVQEGLITIFPRIVVHAPVYDTEAMVHVPKLSLKRTFFTSQKIGLFRIQVHATVEIRNSAADLI